MTKSLSPPKPSSISSEQTGGSERSDSILALGCKLVEELSLEPSVDTLGRWMAHYIAGLIVNAKNAIGEEKDLAEKNCFEAILTLWKHRAELPNGKNPFTDIEPIVRTIESLNPDGDIPRYYRPIRALEKEDQKQSESDLWLNIVDNIDYSAKVLIGYCLSKSAQTAMDKTKEWVKLSEAAGAEDYAQEIVIRFVSDNLDLGKRPNPNTEVRQQFQDRVERLGNFIKLAKIVKNDLKAQLEALPPGEEDDIAAEASFELDSNDQGKA
jgi:hypothetical protein